MKLHLPHGLRTALLAVVSFAAAHTVQAASAVYDHMITADTYHAISTENDTKPDIYHPILSDARSQDWMLHLSASNLTISDEGQTSNAAVLVFRSYSWSVTNNSDGNPSKWEVNNLKDEMFGILIAPDGDLFVTMSNPKGKKRTHRLSNIRNWNWDSIHNIEISLSWNAEEETLYLHSGSIQREEDGEIETFLTDEPDGRVALDYDLPKEWFANSPDPDDNLWIEGDVDSVVTSTLYTQGTTPGWLISGKTSLQGTYENLTTASATTRQIQNGDQIQFVGSEGILYTTTDATLSNNVSVVYDLNHISEGMAIGFGAEAGTTLTVTTGTGAINNNAGKALVPTLNIVGQGTVKLQYTAANTGNLSNVSVNIYDSATLEINSINDGQIDLSKGKFSSLASITKTGNANSNTKLILDAGDTSTTLASISNGTGVLQIQNSGTVKATNIEANGIALTDGVNIIAGSVTSGTDGITIDSASSAVVYGNVSAGGDLEISGSLDVQQQIEAGSVEAINLGSISASAITAETVKADGVTITADDTTAPVLAGNVTVSSTGITANKLADSDIAVEGVTIGSAVSTDSRIGITNDALVATGKLSADSLHLQGEYGIKAKELEALVISDKNTSIKGTVAELASLRNAVIYTDKNDVRIVSADTISADSLHIGDNTCLVGAEVSTAGEVTIASGSSVLDAVINAGDTFDIGTDATLENVIISTQNGTNLENGSKLSNVTLIDGALTNNGTVGLKNFSVITDGVTVNIGGANSNAVKIANSVDSVLIDGKLQDESLTIDKLEVNGEGLDFSEERVTKSYKIIEGDNLSYTYNASRDQINIDSYVHAHMTTDPNGNIQIIGTKDTAGIKQSLADTYNRTAAIKAIDEALGNTPVLATRATTAKSPLQEIHDYVGHVMRYDETSRKNVLSAVSGASLAALADSQRRGLRDVQDNLRNRIIQMGGGTSAGLTTDWEYAGLQAWAQADGGLSTTSGSGDEWGYDFDTMGATVGANLDLTANTVIGMSFSASYGEISVSDSTDHAKGNNDAQYISFFARHNKERWVQMFIFTYGMNEMDMERSVLGYNAKGDTKGQTLSAYYELGYTLGIDYEYEHILQPLVSIGFTSASVDAYDEAGSIGNAGIKYDNNSYFYGQVAVGARYQGVLYETIHERNAVIEARALITHDFGDTTNEASVALAGSEKFTVKGADSSGMGFKIGAGLSIPVEQHTTLYADVDYTSAPDYSGFRGNIGVRYDF